MNIKILELVKCKKYLSPRSLDAHKGLFGHVLIIGGDYGKGGACLLAGEAALRSGAGLVSVATRPEYAFPMISRCPELMCYGIKEAKDLDQILERATVVIIGPGLGQNSWGESLFNRVLKTDLPLVVDADALNLLAKNIQTRENWILTPHPGEASRLLNQSTIQIQQNREAAICALRDQYHGVIVLKGAGTLVLGAGDTLSKCEAGNPGMATAGMGDVLSGVIAALIAQGLTLEQAANLAVCVHATAGDMASKEGIVGVCAHDLFNHIRQCLNFNV